MNEKDMIIELINKLNDAKEKYKIMNDLIKINDYKIFIMCNKKSNDEIKEFIKDTVNDYRDKSELKDYYHYEQDYISPNDLYMLNTLEVMIKKYLLRKTGEDILKKQSE